MDGSPIGRQSPTHEIPSAGKRSGGTRQGGPEPGGRLQPGRGDGRRGVGPLERDGVHHRPQRLDHRTRRPRNRAADALDHLDRPSHAAVLRRRRLQLGRQPRRSPESGPPRRRLGADRLRRMCAPALVSPGRRRGGARAGGRRRGQRRPRDRRGARHLDRRHDRGLQHRRRHARLDGRSATGRRERGRRPTGP